VRLGLCMVKGLANAHAADLIGAHGDQAYRSIADVWQRAGVPVAALERIAEADGFLQVGLDRRQALWEIRGLADSRLPLFAVAEEAAEPAVALPPMPQGGEVVEDYRSVGLSLRRHPVSFLRNELTRERILPCAALTELRDGARATVAGVILVRQRPGSASGVLFVTIEDETGHANLIVWPSVFERQRRLVMSASMLACRGKVQKEGEVIHVIADHLTDFSPLLASVGQREGVFPLAHGRGDAVTHPNGDDPRERGIKVATRDFR
jgi:error-prone DNA polymerase